MDANDCTPHGIDGQGSRRWTAEDRAAAYAAYFRTGSRRKARKQTGVPERTLSMWLRDERYAEERRAVQAGLLRAVEQDAAQRGVELVEATREAILVCRKALRRDPDGRTASSLLTSLMHARETEDRIRRLDGGDATEICGVVLAPDDEDAFREWHAGRQARKHFSVEQLNAELHEAFFEALEEMTEPGKAARLRPFLTALADSSTSLNVALAGDVELAGRLHARVREALDFAQGQQRARDAARGPGGDEATSRSRWAGRPTSGRPHVR